MRRLRTVLALVSVPIVAVGGCRRKPHDDAELPTVHGSGVGSFESRPLPAFTRLHVGGGLEVTANVGKNEPLELRGEDNLFKHVPSNVVAGELKLEPDVALKTTQPLRLVVGTERLEAVSAAIGAKLTVHAVKAESFAVHAGGAARITVDGSATSLTVTGRSIAQIDLTHFSAGNATATAADLSRVRLGYLEKLDATQVGNGVVSYGGTPDVTRHGDKPANIAPSN